MIETILIIKKSVKEKLKKSDWKLIIPYLLLVGIGIMMVYSSSSYFAMTEYSNSEYFFVKQVIFSVAGIFLAFLFSVLGKHLLRSKSIISITLIIILLMLTYLLIFVDPINGSVSWIAVGPVNIQPIEFLKVAVILYLGVFFSNTQEQLANIAIDYYGTNPDSEEHKLKGLLSHLWYLIKKPALFLTLFLLLVLIQPDLGGTIILGAICLVMFILSGVPFKLGLLSLGIMGTVYSLFLAAMKWLGDIPFMPSYMVERFSAFLDPFGDVQKSSFQLVNSFYALSRGGIFGVGIGESVQKSGYLPESYTDFIIPIIGEELGLVGVLVVLSIFFYMIYHIYKISLKIKDSFGQLVCIGIATMFLLQGIINVGGAVGVMPLTGVTFPFVSYGGSSMLVSSVAIGIVNNIYINEKHKRE